MSSRLFEVLLERRGVAAGFLSPKYDETWLCDAGLLPDIEKAVGRLVEARDKGEKVLVFGDYDADGITASTVMVEGLEAMGVTVAGVMLPNRFEDGYGMNPGVIVRAVECEATLVVTVDTGSGGEDVIAGLLEQGVETIVTDHHECLKRPKSAVAVVNPKRKISKYPNRDLAGVGVAFKVICALDKRLSEREGRVEGWEKWLLDLVAIGTVCDSVPLVGENRALVYWGMKVLEKTRRVGLEELIRESSMKRVDAVSVGFLLGPRLNAAGRMDSPYRAYELLREESRPKAAELTTELCGLNAERRDLQDKAFESACRKVGKNDKNVLCVKGVWHQGVIGIVAGKMLDKYHKPCIVFTKQKDILVGSARSFGDFDLAEALESCKEYTVGGGGHKYAAGVKIDPEKFEEFNLAINTHYSGLGLSDQEEFLRPKAEVVVTDLAELTAEFAHDLERLEPFGEGNYEPVIELQGMTVTDVNMMGRGEKHLALMVAGVGGAMRLIAFSAPDEWKKIESGAVVNVLAHIRLNEWRGIERVEGEIVEITDSI